MFNRNQRMDILAYLRTHTADLHTQIEQRLPFFSPAFDLEQYKRIVSSFYGYLMPLERRMSASADLRSPVDLSSRRKTPALQDDLNSLGVDSSRVRLCSVLPDLSNESRLIGCLYVIEGSTLGGQIISRRLAETLGLRRESGAAYFHGYGLETAARWKEFRTAVAGVAPSLKADETLAGARQTFITLDEWLAEIS